MEILISERERKELVREARNLSRVLVKMADHLEEEEDTPAILEAILFSMTGPPLGVKVHDILIETSEAMKGIQKIKESKPEDFT